MKYITAMFRFDVAARAEEATLIGDSTEGHTVLCEDVIVHLIDPVTSNGSSIMRVRGRKKHAILAYCQGRGDKGKVQSLVTGTSYDTPRPKLRPHEECRSDNVGASTETEGPRTQRKARKDESKSAHDFCTCYFI
jgi:hypothetical protein